MRALLFALLLLCGSEASSPVASDKIASSSPIILELKLPSPARFNQDKSDGKQERGLQFQETAQIGTPANGGKDVLLANRGTYTLSFTSQQGIKEVQVVASIFYGRVDIYATLDGREPTTSYYNVSSGSSGMPDLLVIPTPVANKQVKVLVRASGETKLRLLLAAPDKQASPLSLGIPQREYLDAPPSPPPGPPPNKGGKGSSKGGGKSPPPPLPLPLVQSLFTYTPSTSNTFYVVVTVLSAGGNSGADDSGLGAAASLGITVTAPKSNKVVTGQSSDGTVAVAVLQSEIGLAFKVVVSGRTAAMFSVMVAEGTPGSPQQLLAGLPQQGFTTLASSVIAGGAGGAGVGPLQFFVLQAGPSQLDFDITCAPLTGEVRMLVNADDGGDSTPPLVSPSFGFYVNASVVRAAKSQRVFPGATWATISSSFPASLRIAAGSPGHLGRAGGRYLVTVVSSRASSFLLRGGAADSITTLAEGFPVVGQVPKDAYRYFRFFDQSPHLATVFDLIPTTGDADLFVGCRCQALGTDAGYPSRMPGHYNFSSQRWQEDAVSVPAGDARSCSRQGARGGGGGGGGAFYISVLGFSGSSDFTLSALHQGGTQTLTAGQSLEGTVFKNIGAWYRFRLGMEAQRLSISLTPITGDADLFVRFGATAQVFAFDYRSSKLGAATDTIVIAEQDVCTDCWVSVLVFGYTTSRYMVSFSLEETTLQLRDGMPQKGSVAQGDYQYFTLPLPAQSPEGSKNTWLVVSLVVTVFSGAPVLVASTDHEFPTLSSNLTSFVLSETTGNAIPALLLPTLPLGVPLYIGVGGADTNASFTVRASVETMSLQYPPLLQLLEGVPQLDSMDIHDGAALSWRYYQIGVTAGHNTLKVRATDLIGEIDVFVTRCPFASAYQCEGGIHSRGGLAAGSTKGASTTISTTSSARRSFLPNETYWQWSSVDQGPQDSLSIPRNDQGPTTYLVGVYAQSFFSAYTIAYSFEDTVLALQAGVQVQDVVKLGKTDYYSFAMPPQQDGVLKITITRLSGDPDVFVSTTHRWPTNHNSTWRAVRFGSDVLTIDPSKDTDKSACYGCTYYIGVMGATDSSYIISASLDSTTPHLLDGVPLSDSVTALAWNYYQFDFTYGTQRDFRVVLSASTGRPSLFLTLDGHLPTLLHFQYSDAELFGTGQLAIQVQSSDSTFTKYCAAVNSGSSSSKSCAVRVGVLGVPSGSTYSLTLATVSAATLLPLDQPASGALASDQYHAYRVALRPADVGSKAFTLRFALTAQTGRLSLFASCRYSSPNATHHQWAADAASSPSPLEVVLDVASADAQDVGCGSANQFYVVVYGGSLAQGATGGSYSLVATLPADRTSVVLLLPGVPMTTQVSFHTVRYFYVRPGQSFESIRISASCIAGGDVDLYVSATFEKKPTVDKVSGKVSSFLLSSMQSGAEEALLLSNTFIQNVCVGRLSCYLVVAAVGVSGKATGKPFSFTIVASLADATTALQEGVPLRGVVPRHGFSYYSFPVSKPQVDVTISVTSFSEGDPDIYVGLGMHPTRGNFTWSSSTFGKDTLTIQAGDLVLHGCQPDPSTGRICKLFIGVYGWTNVTFSISAKHDSGFASPSVLLDGQPQSGTVQPAQYTYFRYYISSDAPKWDALALPTSMTVTLTPTGQTDLDLYLSFEGSGEPGKQKNDYKSTKWSVASESITITASMAKFCTSCWVYLAVYGYESGGSFSLVAQSSRMQTLQGGHAAGGRVEENQWRYYSFFSSDSTAQITLALTVLSGDADIYVSTYTPQGLDSSTSLKAKQSVPLPTRESFVWRSMHYGDDSLTILPSDPAFCSGCDLLVGVLGYKNTSYTLLATQSQGGPVSLVYSRPQVVTVSRAGTNFFTVPEVFDDEEVVTFSLTALSSPGSSNPSPSLKPPSSSPASASPSDRLADLFLQVRPAGNASILLRPLDPTNPKTYSQSTLSSMDDVLVYRPTPGSGAVSFLLAVVTHSALRYSIVARSQQTAVLLQPGVPQQHFVAKGQTAQFSFLPTSDMLGVRISAVARTGDPDMVVSQDFEQPRCSIDTSHPLPEGATNYPTICTDYTWSSRSFNNDQIIISADAPCEAVVPTTYVVPSCDPESSFVPGDGRPLHIGVFGYEDTKFSILVAAAGAHVLLLPGIPVKSATALGFLCSQRVYSTGACTADSPIKKRVQVAYFTFSSGTWTPAPDGLTGRAATFSVVPNCDSSTDSSMAGKCSPGCDCAPLVMYANSCPRTKCTEADMLPSPLPGQSQASLTVTSAGSRELVLGGDKCLAGEECLHYVAVIVQSPPDSPTAAVTTTTTTTPVTPYADTPFTITARTSGDVVLIPCETAGGDGVRFEATDAGQQVLYELCGATSSDSSASSDGLTVAIEQCTGSSTLYACSDDPASQCRSVVPSANSWAFKASRDGGTCVMKKGRPQCSPSATSLSSPEPAVQLSLPRSSGSFYLLADGSADSSFTLRVIEDVSRSPLLVQAGAGSEAHTTISAAAGTSAQLTWSPALVLMPGLRSASLSQELVYSAVFVLDSASKPAANRFVLGSRCGLLAAVNAQAAVQRGVVLTGSPAFSEGPLTYSFDHLLPRQTYRVAIIATCDGACLALAAKQGNSNFCKRGDCLPVHLVYETASFTTGNDNSKDGAGGAAGNGSAGAGWAVAVGVLVVSVLLCAMGGLLTYWQRTKRELSLAGFDEMEMVDTVIFSKGSSLLGGGPATPTPDGINNTAADDGGDLSSSSHPLSGLSIFGAASPARRLSLGERLSLAPNSATPVFDIHAASEKAAEWAGIVGSGLGTLARRAMDGASGAMGSGGGGGGRLNLGSVGGGSGGGDGGGGSTTYGRSTRKYEVLLANTGDESAESVSL